MVVRSLTQAEAEERASLLTVERYDIGVDLTDLPSGPLVRCESTITLPVAGLALRASSTVRQTSRAPRSTASPCHQRSTAGSR